MILKTITKTTIQKRFIAFLLALHAFVSLPSFANEDFMVRLELFVSEINPHYEVNVFMKNPEKIPADCPFPLFDVPNKKRTWGNINISVHCDKKRHTIPIYAKAIGEVIIATSDINQGDGFNGNTATIRYDISNLPIAPIIDSTILDSAQAVRHIKANSVINLPMIKRSWVIKAGDTVTITYIGEGFSAMNMGKALNNGYQGDKIRLRLDNKSVVEAIVMAEGQATIYAN